MKFYLLATAILVFAALVAFGVPALLALHGTQAIVFIVVVLLLGVGAAAALLIWHFRSKNELEKEQSGNVTPGASTGELDMLLNDANRKLRDSQQRAKTLDGLPVIYILGDAGSAKTTTVIRSGLDAELVAGAVPREGESAPTQVLNLWFTRQAALLEVGVPVGSSQHLLTRLVERTRPKAYRSAFGTGAAARAAIVCVSAEQILAADGGASLLASARHTGGQLREISRLLGATLPVYVIVTKLDRVPHFEKYVRNLSNEEVRQILGSPLPRSQASAGVYADEASRTLARILDGLCYRLGEFRVEMLERETEPQNAPGVYEFPREFGKLRKNLNQYLVELSKPSQLSANPYLRGFYFTGIRAQMVERMVSAPAAAPQPALNEGATQYLNISAGKTQAASRPAPAMVATRVPQWTFLPRLLPEIILGDKSALSATNQTAPARLFRRILYSTLAFLFLIYTICLAVSFLNNRALENKIQAAARALPATSAPAISLPSLSDLKNLDRLRQVILQLNGYNNGDSHWGYRFGLYQGEKLEGEARRIYFDRFRPAMLNPTQASWIKNLHDLPDQGTDYSLYNEAYSQLKAYLITAGNHDKSVPQFLTPVFLKYWVSSRQVDPDSQQLAQAQIDFYATELIHRDPYAIRPDAMVVPHAQAYLHSFGAEPSIYRAMLADADKTRPAGIDFNKLYPGSAVAVIDAHVVRGAFSRDGFAFMQNAIQHPEKYASGEQWVLGEQTGQPLVTATLSKDLAALYSSDFINEWHAFLTSARVMSCGGVHEAPAKLNLMAGSNSPLLELFYTVSHNTAVSDPAIKSVFQPAQALVDPNAPDRLIGPGNNSYVGALLALSSSIDQVATQVGQNPAMGGDAAAYMPINQAASAAKLATNTTAQSFNPDDPKLKIGSTVLQLMQDPIECAAKIPPSPGAAANGGGAKVCAAVNSLLGKFPFSTKSATPATLAEVNQAFAPDTGTVWTIYNTILKPYLVPQVAQYVAAPNSPQPVNPRYPPAFTRIARVSSGLYPGGAKSPALSFTLRFLQASSTGVASATFVVDGQRIPAGITTQNFTWNGESAQRASVIYDGTEVPASQGTWSLFQLVREAQITKTPGGYRLDYHIDNQTTFQGQKIGQSGASTKIVSFELSGPGADLLAGDGLSGLGCISQVVK